MSLRTTPIYALASAAALALGVAAGCTPAKGYHPESDVPENHARVHKPEYRGGEVEPGELEPVDPQADVERGDPPPRVGAAWSDPNDLPPLVVTAVVIDTSLAELCGIEAAQAQFDYDSAKLDAEARATVSALADCFTSGPLAGHELEVVGHTDPRGPDDYNQELGMSRAQNVAEALIRNGLSEQRIAVESEGEAEASEQPSQWPADRRVDLMLAG